MSQIDLSNDQVVAQLFKVGGWRSTLRL